MITDPRMGTFLLFVLRVMEVVLWLGTAAALVSHLGGNPTAINAVIGVGIWAVIVTVLDVGSWWIFRGKV